jgi:hypothetical protein
LIRPQHNGAQDLFNLAGMRQKRDDTSPLSTAGVDPWWRLLWHIVVTVLLLAALASTAAWLLLGSV